MLPLSQEPSLLGEDRQVCLQAQVSGPAKIWQAMVDLAAAAISSEMRLMRPLGKVETGHGCLLFSSAFCPIRLVWRGTGTLNQPGHGNL